MSTAKVINIVHPSGTINNLVNDANGGIVIGGTLTANANVTVSGTVVMSSSFKRNRIINGNMAINQRNAGASITGNSGAYPVDRWETYATQSSKLTCQQSTTVPSGFKNSVLYTSSSAYSVTASDYFSVSQRIEGYNVSDLNFGTASAATVTLSFWVRCSLTGTFGGACHNNAFNRAYPFTYTISAANTWEQKTVTIAGDTTGTWTTDNSVGLEVGFSLGCGSTGLGTPGAWTATSNIYGATGQVNLVGTSGATFYITGVQLEVGTVATPYEMQIYSDQLAQCQRYYYRINAGSNYTKFGVGLCGTTSSTIISVPLPVTMRTYPTTLDFSAVSSFVIYDGTTNTTVTGIALSDGSTNSLGVSTTNPATLTQSRPAMLESNGSAAAYIGAIAEL